MTTSEYNDMSCRVEKAGKEASSDKNIQKLAEGCIWIGATWMANALGIKGFNNKEE